MEGIQTQWKKNSNFQKGYFIVIRMNKYLFCFVYKRKYSSKSSLHYMSNLLYFDLTFSLF